MITNKRKQILHSSLFTLHLSLALLLCSCNLFIEEEEQETLGERVFENVPVHTGEGYDAPVTMTDGGCEVTYQYKSDVRLLTQDVQDRYIVYVQNDEANAFVEIHYAPNTPESILPVPGEILVSTVTDKFPWGCNHRVQYRIDDDGVIKYVASFATLEDTYADLRIDGTATNQYTEEFDVVSYDPVDLDENGDPIEDQSANARTRGFDFNVGDCHVKVDTETMEFNIPFSWSDNIEYDGLHGNISMDKDKNFYKITNKLDFSGFSITDGNFVASLTQTMEEQTNIQITGGYSKNWRLLRIPAIKGKAIAIGPVVLVLFVNIDLDLTLDFSVSTTITKQRKTRTIYDIDFYHLTFNQRKEVLYDTGWTLGDICFTGYVSMDVKFNLGLGIYGKILSVRIIPTFTAKLEAQQPLFYTDENGEKTFDIADKLGVTFSFDFSVTVGVYLDISLSNILGATVGDQKKLLKELEADAKTASQYYQDMNDEQAAQFDPNKKHYSRLGGTETQKEGDEELGKSFTIGPFHIIGPTSLSWFPTIKDKSFKVEKIWDKSTQKMTFAGEFTCQNIGFFGGMGKKYVPALKITKGSKYIYTIFPEEGGKDAYMQRDMTYHFDIPTVEDDATYTATPVYYCRPVGRFNPDAVDKGLPFCFTSPSMTITDVKPLYVAHDHSPEGFIFDGDKSYTHMYTFAVLTYTAAKGMANIDDWYLQEINSKERHRFDKYKNWKEDGTYVMRWEFDVYTNDDDTKAVKLAFYPLYMVNSTANTGETYRIKVYSDWTYELPEDDDGFSMRVSFLSSSRMATPVIETDNPEDRIVIL